MSGPDPTFAMDEDAFDRRQLQRDLIGKGSDFAVTKAQGDIDRWVNEQWLDQMGKKKAAEWLWDQNARDYENQQRAIDWQRQQQAQQSAWGNESAQANAARAHEARLAESRQNALRDMWGQMAQRRMAMQGGGGPQYYGGGGQMPQQSNNLLSLYNQSGEHF